MNIIKGFEGFYIADRNYDGFISSLPPTNTEMEIIGYSEGNDFPIYGVKYGDVTGKNVLFLVSSLHSSTEWSTAWSCRNFLEILSNPNSHPDQKKYIDLINNYYDGIYWIPIGNPWGYNNNSRLNKNGVDINRDFADPNPQSETQVIKTIVNQIKPSVLFDVHEKISPSLALASIDEGEDIDNTYRHKTQRAIEISTMLLNRQAQHWGTLGGAGAGELRRWAGTVPKNKDNEQIESGIIEIGDSNTSGSVENKMITWRTKQGINALFSITLAFNPLFERNTIMVNKGG